MAKILVIYELIPENTSFYVHELVSANPEDSDLIKNLKNVHGCVVNTDLGDDDQHEMINRFVEEFENKNHTWVEINKGKLSDLIQIKPDYIFWFGFLS